MNSKSKEILTKNVKKERINVIFYNIKKLHWPMFSYNFIWSKRWCTVLDFICGPFSLNTETVSHWYLHNWKKEKKNKMKKGKRKKYRCVTAFKSKYNKIYRFNKVHEARSIVRS